MYECFKKINFKASDNAYNLAYSNLLNHKKLYKTIHHSCLEGVDMTRIRVSVLIKIYKNEFSKNYQKQK